MIVVLLTVAWVVALTIAFRVTRDLPARDSLLIPTAPGLVTVAYFVALNTFNFCPDRTWCASYGFPLQYLGESYHMTVIDSAPFDPGALVIDLCLALTVEPGVCQPASGSLSPTDLRC